MNKRIQGFTLVELMVALAAGAFLLAGVSLSYSAIKSTITITQPSGVIACDGSATTAQVVEVYSLNGSNLMCSLDGAASERLLTGIETLSFSIAGELVTVSVKPNDLPAQFGNGINIDIALTNSILVKAYGAGGV